QQVQPEPRREKPVCGRWQFVRLRRPSESDADDSGALDARGGVHGRGDAEGEHLSRIALLAITAAVYAAEPPVQPIPYSHRQHIALGLKCGNCHEMPDPGEMMGIPAAAKCMTCHQSVKKASPAIQKLAGFVERKELVPWVRVYQIPAYVVFSHKNH